MAISHVPQAVRMTPVAELSQMPRGSSFSSDDQRERAIQKIFMTPATKSSPINAQQHRRKSPCSRPIRKAAAAPSRQRVMMKSNGARHCVRQACLSG